MTKLIQICFSPLTTYDAYGSEQTCGGDMYGLDDRGRIWIRAGVNSAWFWSLIDDGISSGEADEDKATE